jgi:hypothetical protein
MGATYMALPALMPGEFSVSSFAADGSGESWKDHEYKWVREEVDHPDKKKKNEKKPKKNEPPSHGKWKFPKASQKLRTRMVGNETEADTYETEADDAETTNSSSRSLVQLPSVTELPSVMQSVPVVSQPDAYSEAAPYNPWTSVERRTIQLPVMYNQ